MKNNNEIIPHCECETGKLVEVILGYPDNFYADPDMIISQTMAETYSTGNKPTSERAKPEFDNFKKTMEERGVSVYQPSPYEVTDQLTPRDIGFVIGKTFFVSNMATDARRKEWNGIQYLIKLFPKVVWVPESIVIEGGDIVVDKGFVFVGISQRTTENGFKWLKTQLENSGFTIIPVYLKSLGQGEHVLHLDCAFVPVGEKHALIYPKGMQEVPTEILDNYDLIEVTKEEQSDLATNVLSISPACIVIRHTATRINEVLSNLGIEVIPIKFDEAPKTGGSFRCCTLPLIRQSL